MIGLKGNVSVATTIAPGAYTATATGTGVDLVGYDTAAVVIVTGAVSNTDFSFEVQDSDLPSSEFVAVADELLDGTEPATAVASTVTTIGYLGRKRYLRVVATDGGDGSGSFTVLVVRGNPRKRPV